MGKYCFSILAAIMLLGSTTVAQEYSAEKIDQAPQTDEVSEEILSQIADSGVRVKRGATRTYCEFWLCKQVAVDPDFQRTPERLYPLQVGQLVGVLHFPRRGKEFRDQTVSSGWYTLRFALQPVDGNHEGTSPTRDFLLLVDAADDELPETWDEEPLYEASAEAAGSNHPALMCLQRPTEGSQLAIRHNDEHDWWVVHTVAEGKAGDKTVQLPIDLVVVGHAAE